MSNNKSTGELYQGLVDTLDFDEKREALIRILELDNDMTENEDYFREDTLELGYENEAERIVTEYLEDNTVDGDERFKEAMKEIFTHISDQEYYGTCDIDFIEVKPGLIAYAYFVGGN